VDEKNESQNQQNLGHWKLKTDFVDNAFGFVYEITNNVSGRKYIGKKQMRSVRKLKPLKGKKKNRRVEKETDWKTYTGSSNELNDDIKNLGKEKFSFDILRFCNSKSHLAYEEIKYQIQNDVILKEEYYNGIINCRLGKIKF
jgi:hypothetical protein